MCFRNIVQREGLQIFTGDLDKPFIRFILAAAIRTEMDEPRLANVSRKSRPRLIAKIAVIFVPIAVIAWLTVSMLVPYMTNPPSPRTLLNKTVILTDENYEARYFLALTKGEKIDIKVSGNGQPVDFRITDNRTSTFIEKNGDMFYDLPWEVPADGTYTFYVSAYAGDVRATLIVAKE
jgi:hypothetical protein